MTLNLISFTQISKYPAVVLFILTEEMKLICQYYLYYPEEIKFILLQGGDNDGNKIIIKFSNRRN